MNNFSVEEQILTDFPVGFEKPVSEENEKPVSLKNRSKKKLSRLGLAILLTLMLLIGIVGVVCIVVMVAMTVWAWYMTLLVWPVWTTVITSTVCGIVGYFYKKEYIDV